MTTEQFIRRNQIIGERLAQIAACGQYLQHGAAPPDLRLRAVLQAQERLLNAMERLLDDAVAGAPA